MTDQPLLECVPNVSEGARVDVLTRLGHAVEAAGARLLDVHRDVDHHRAVFTFLGPVPAVEGAALALGRLAVELIDLRGHAGAHPRIGAVDVLPFVPLAGLAMAEAVAAAHRVGRAFADATGVPVFFYEEAALRPERRALPAVRAGGFEGLGARLASTLWRPDAGPAAPHPTAGATAVGARGPLVAFNANLDTGDVAQARAIAAVIRERAPGGLPGVRAVGVRLESRRVAQVSMNLLDYRRTPPRRVIARVSEEAARRGVGVREYELVGCAPADAFADDVAALVRDLKPSQLLDPAMFGPGR
jgi:glutamate formiminotransferase / 5-formyltetrahydrofolate cyclo-ligase